MKKIFTLVAFTLITFALLAQSGDGYNPENPGDPAIDGYSHNVKILVEPSVGGYVSISGFTMIEGYTKTVYAYSYSNYKFVAWKQNGELISTANSLTITMGTTDLEYTACFEYDPGNPGDPSIDGYVHEVNIYAEPSDGGYFSSSSFTMVEGSTKNVYAYSDENYRFLAWEQDGNVVSYSNPLKITMGTTDLTYTGIFEYVPDIPLTGEILLSNTNYVYNGYYQYPEWQFSDPSMDSLVQNVDYKVIIENNLYPGEATLKVVGIGFYTGTLSTTFYIEKASMTETQYKLSLPEIDITFDAQSHGAKVSTSYGVGEVTIYYESVDNMDTTTAEPFYPGCYNVYLEIAEGPCYYGMEMRIIGSFCIYEFNADEWEILKVIHSDLLQKGWSQPWDMSQGVEAVSTFMGLTIREGRVREIDLCDMALSGEFPIDVLSLSQLQKLNLSNNFLYGNVDDVIETSVQYQSLTYMDISNNKFAGNIGLFAQAFPNLNFLSAHSNKLEDVEPMISPNVSTLYLDSQTMDRIMEVHANDLKYDIMITKVPTLLLYDHYSQSYNKPIELYCTTKDDWKLILALYGGEIYLYNDDNVYKGTSGDTLSVSAMGYYDYNACNLRMKLNFDEGDTNFDGHINVLDLQNVINNVFSEYNNKLFNFTAANLQSNDDYIDVLDVIALVNKLMSDVIPVRQNFDVIDESITDACLYWRDNQLILETTKDIAALDIILSNEGNVMWNTDLNMTVSYSESIDNHHIIVYSLSGRFIPEGENVLLTTNKICDVRSLLLADKNASEVKVDVEIIDVVNLKENKENDIRCQYNGEQLQLNISSPHAELNWNVFTIDGNLLSEGILPASITGVVDLCPIKTHTAMIVVVRDSYGLVLTQKINTINK